MPVGARGWEERLRRAPCAASPEAAPGRIVAADGRRGRRTRPRGRGVRSRL